MSRDFDNRININCGFCSTFISVPSEFADHFKYYVGDGNFIYCCPNCRREKAREKKKLGMMDAEKMFNANDDTILREDMPVFAKILALTLLIVFVYIIISLIIF